MFTSSEIRKKFLTFFANKQHAIVRSSSLIPLNDPTLLFTNAGMNQFKDYFLGNEKPPYRCATTVQKVMRAGGKHNDLENVGYTSRHQTFFEMLGNFSFGAYFKKEAIAYAWEFLTNELKLDKEKLAVSIYQDDDESYSIWHNDIGLPSDSIAKLGAKENFWEMGAVGPCGPCTEIHYLIEPLLDEQTKKASLEADDGHCLEIWNLVFMQFSQKEDGTREPLPNPCVDTGMGLERICSILQNVSSNYETDLFKPFIEIIAKNVKYQYGQNTQKDTACRVISDHVRATYFLLADGVIPSNEGAGYVLRRIIRRTARYGRELGYSPGFLADLSSFLIDSLSEAYPELLQNKEFNSKIVRQEELRFANTLQQGLRVLENIVKENKAPNTVIDGEAIFYLYDTYGFPSELASEYLHDRGLSFDSQSYEKAMKEQRNRAKTAHVDTSHTLQIDPVYLTLFESHGKNQFIGYNKDSNTTKILSIIKDKKEIDNLQKNDFVEIFLQETPFYAESGGQVGDKGYIETDFAQLQVIDSYKSINGLFLSKAKVLSSSANKLILPCVAKAQIDTELRKQIRRNHTATHLLQAALKQVLGEHIKQAGSLVTPEKLRFDFTHYSAISPAEIKQLEEWIQVAILSNIPLTTTLMSLDEALESGAIALFDEKYTEQVRVIQADEYTKELCGGTHVKRLGDIGLFKILSEESIAAGTRRIEAITGMEALQFIQNESNLLQQVNSYLKATSTTTLDKLNQLQTQLHDKDKQIETFQNEARQAYLKQILTQQKTIQSVSFVATLSKDKDLRSLCLAFQKSTQKGVLLLGYKEENKITIAIAVTTDIKQKISAGSLVKEFSSLLDAKGGGKPDFAQCGGTNPNGWNTFTTAIEDKIFSILA